MLHRILDYSNRGQKEGLKQWVGQHEMRVIEEMLAIRDDRRLKYVAQMLKATFGQEVDEEEVLKRVFEQ